jgi:hypothetical protein
VRGHLVEDTGYRVGVGILDDRIVEQVEHYKVAVVGCKGVGGQEHRIADLAGKGDIVTEEDQLVADMLELEAQVQDIAETRLVVGETSYVC